MANKDNTEIFVLIIHSFSYLLVDMRDDMFTDDWLTISGRFPDLFYSGFNPHTKWCVKWHKLSLRSSCAPFDMVAIILILPLFCHKEINDWKYIALKAEHKLNCHWRLHIPVTTTICNHWMVWSWWGYQLTKTVQFGGSTGNIWNLEYWISDSCCIETYLIHIYHMSKFSKCNWNRYI